MKKQTSLSVEMSSYQRTPSPTHRSLGGGFDNHSEERSFSVDVSPVLSPVLDADSPTSESDLRLDITRLSSSSTAIRLDDDDTHAGGTLTLANKSMSQIKWNDRIMGLICIVIGLITNVIMSLMGGEFKSPFYERFVVNSMWVLLAPFWLVLRSMTLRQTSLSNSRSNECSSSNRIDSSIGSVNSGGFTIVNDAESPCVSGELSNVSEDGNDHSDDHRRRCLRPQSTVAINSNASATGDSNDDSFEIETDKSEALSLKGTLEFTRIIWMPTLLLSIVSLVSGFLWYESLQHTDFAVNNTLSQTAPVFVYALNLGMGVTRASESKTLSVAVSMIGVAIISYACEEPDSSSESPQSSANKTSLLGIVLCLISTLVYSLFFILGEWMEKYYYRRNTRVMDSLLVTSLIGPLTVIFFGPIIMISLWFSPTMAHWLRLSHSTCASPWNEETSAVFWNLVLLGGLDVICNAALLVGILYTNAMVMSGGAMLIVPVSFILDSLVWQKYTPSLLGFVGVVLVCVGFALMELPLLDYCIFPRSIRLSKMNRRTPKYSQLPQT